MRTDDCDEAAPGDRRTRPLGRASAAEAAAARSMNRGGRTIGGSPSRVGGVAVAIGLSADEFAVLRSIDLPGVIKAHALEAIGERRRTL